jgi:hypothetical protein
MGPRLINMEYCSVPGVHGQNGRVYPSVHHRIHGEGHMGAWLINMEYCSIPGVHRQNGASLPRCPPQASMGKDTWAPGSSTWNTVRYLGSTGRIGVSAQVSTTGFHGEGHMGAQSPAKLNFS